MKPSADARPVVIAIIDDGFRITHQDLKPFVWQNPGEISGNRRDDDGNGCIDDIAGWDVADGDANVTVPEDRLGEFYHGTHLAGIISKMARHALGENAADWIRIMPVKAISDSAEKMIMQSGYKGIQYAADMKADIILTAWSAYQASPEDLRVLQDARDRGAILVGSAGNAYSADPLYPAAHDAVISVAAVNREGVKLEQSSYGGTVDILAPGMGVASASTEADDSYASRDGTSFSAAMVAGAIALMKLVEPDYSYEELRARLFNTAVPVEQLQGGELFYGGKLGCGKINLAAAMGYDLEQASGSGNYLIQSYRGYLVRYRKSSGPTVWRLRNQGDVDGFWIIPESLEGDSGDARLQVYLSNEDGTMPFLDLPLRDWNEQVYIPDSGANIVLMEDPDGLDYRFLCQYKAKPVDQSTLYCGGISELENEGLIEDGSGEALYSPQSDCKWLITAPAGKAVHVEFLEFDTEPNTDWVYFFNGSTTNAPIMAVYSGPNIPPELTSWSNQVLIWFVTDSSRQAGGWKAAVKFVGRREIRRSRQPGAKGIILDHESRGDP